MIAVVFEHKISERLNSSPKVISPLSDVNRDINTYSYDRIVMTGSQGLELTANIGDVLVDIIKTRLMAESTFPR